MALPSVICLFSVHAEVIPRARKAAEGGDTFPRTRGGTEAVSSP